jgi:hypothetical protein
LSSLPASAARPPEAQCRITVLSVEKFLSALAEVGSALNSSEPRGMWIAPAALPVAATSVPSRTSTKSAPLATISCASLPEIFGTAALAASSSCLALVGIGDAPVVAD